MPFSCSEFSRIRKKNIHGSIFVAKYVPYQPSRGSPAEERARGRGRGRAGPRRRSSARLRLYSNVSFVKTTACGGGGEWRLRKKEKKKEKKERKKERKNERQSSDLAKR